MNEYGENTIHTSSALAYLFSGVGAYLHPLRWSHPYSGPPPEGWDVEPEEWGNDDDPLARLLGPWSKVLNAPQPRTFTLTVPKWLKCLPSNGPGYHVCDGRCPLYSSDMHGDSSCGAGLALIDCGIAYPSRAVPFADRPGEQGTCRGSPDYDVEIECTVKG